MRKSFLWTLLIFNLILLPLLFYANHRAASKKFIVYANPETVSLPTYGTVADFQLIEKSKAPISLNDFKGSPWVASFMFARCTGQCPAMNLKVSGLQEALPPDVRLVSFSVDPENDTPEVLSQYAKNFKAQNNRWLFLTGEKTTLNRLLKSFHVNTADNRNLHSLRVVLVDSKSDIRGYYDSSDEKAVKKLLEDTQTLIQEEKKEQ